jgi:hypothetical protein
MPATQKQTTPGRFPGDEPDTEVWFIMDDTRSVLGLDGHNVTIKDMDHAEWLKAKYNLVEEYDGGESFIAGKALDAVLVDARVKGVVLCGGKQRRKLSDKVFQTMRETADAQAKEEVERGLAAKWNSCNEYGLPPIMPDCDESDAVLFFDGCTIWIGTLERFEGLLRWTSGYGHHWAINPITITHWMWLPKAPEVKND